MGSTASKRKGVKSAQSEVNFETSLARATFVILPELCLIIKGYWELPMFNWFVHHPSYESAQIDTDHNKSTLTIRRESENIRTITNRLHVTCVYPLTLVEQNIFSVSITTGHTLVSKPISERFDWCDFMVGFCNVFDHSANAIISVNESANMAWLNCCGPSFEVGGYGEIPENDNKPNNTTRITIAYYPSTNYVYFFKNNSLAAFVAKFSPELAQQCKFCVRCFQPSTITLLDIDPNSINIPIKPKSSLPQF